MIRRVLAVVAVAVTCAAGPVDAASPNGSTTGINGVLYDDCVAQPYQYAVHVPSGAGYRALRASLLDPRGKVADTDYVVPDANDSTGTSSFRLCRPTDPYGTYTIRATVEWGHDATSIGKPVALEDSHFSMRKPRTRTTVSASTLRPAHGQVVTYRLRALDERPTGYGGTSAAWVLLQKKVAGHWVRITGSRAMTHRTGYITVRIRYQGHRTPLRVRAMTQPTSRYARSTSPSIRLW